MTRRSDEEINEKAKDPDLPIAWKNYLVLKRQTWMLSNRYFRTKNTNLGQFWRVFQLKMFVFLMAIGSFLRPLGMFYCNFVYFVVPNLVYFSVLVCCTVQCYDHFLQKLSVV
jgi:hypothetical protein